MSRVSAGLLMYRKREGRIEVLLAHPGGPFFRNKDVGVWSIPKGEPDDDEDLLTAAQREFAEETGIQPAGPFIALNTVKQAGGKLVHAWAFPGDCNPDDLVSNTFTVQWPPKSGRFVEFPEMDRADFFDLEAAQHKINPAQVKLLEQLAGMADHLP